MTFYRKLGDVPVKRHIQHRGPQGRLYFEEMIGEEGFSSDSSLLYHKEIPSAIVRATSWGAPPAALLPNSPMLPRHLRLHSLFSEDEWRETDPVTGRRLVLGNSQVRMYYASAGTASPLYRNAIGDECLYVESGSATVETVLGRIPAKPGDQVVIPRGITHRWVPDGDERLRLFIIEASSHINPARRYLSVRGQLLENAPFSERDLHGPSEPLIEEGSDVEVLVRHRSTADDGIVGSRFVYKTHPFDVVGWDGCLYPYTFNIADFEPISGRVHPPPTVHQVFEGDGFVICNFVPRRADDHPVAVPVPYYHSNVDSDEVMFYCGGDYEARKGSGITLGSISLHPGSHSHGAAPGAYERSLGMARMDEWAVMVDTFRPLDIGAAGREVEDPGYSWSWAKDVV